jgi:hypothetical protein
VCHFCHSSQFYLSFVTVFSVIRHSPLCYLSQSSHSVSAHLDWQLERAPLLQRHHQQRVPWPGRSQVCCAADVSVAICQLEWLQLHRIQAVHMSALAASIVVAVVGSLECPFNAMRAMCRDSWQDGIRCTFKSCVLMVLRSMANRAHLVAKLWLQGLLDCVHKRGPCGAISERHFYPLVNIGCAQAHMHCACVGARRWKLEGCSRYMVFGPESSIKQHAGWV